MARRDYGKGKECACIYIIQSLVHTDRVYIGSTITPRSRWCCHKRILKANKHHSCALQNHYNKYGIGDLVFKIIEVCEKSSLRDREQYYINNDVHLGYFNALKAVDRAKDGRPVKDAARLNSGCFHKDMTAWNKGVPLTEEHRASLREAWKERRKTWTMSEENKEAVRRRSVGHIPWNKGKTKYDDERIMSASMRNMGSKHHCTPHSEETRAKIRKNRWPNKTNKVA